MDDDPWNLWGPSFFPASSERSHCSQNEWQCDFYFGYGTDVMEEDAMNEKSCVQVLRILLMKADTEINELEKELVSLQSELAWFEYEEWSEICCGALRERIDDLNISIRNLRDMDNNDIEVHLLVHTESIATIHEILNAFLTKYLQEKDKQEQQSDATEVVDSSSQTPVHETELLDYSSKVSDGCSDATLKEGVKESRDNSSKHHKILCIFSSVPQEKKTSSAQTDKLVSLNIKDSSTDLLKSATDEKNLWSNFNSKRNENAEAEELSNFSEDNGIIKDLSLKPPDEKMRILETVKFEPGIMHASEHVVNHSNVKKILSNSCLNIKSEEKEEHNSIHALNAVVAKIDPWENAKHANAYEKGSPDALRCAAGFDGRKTNPGSGLGAFETADIEQNLARGGKSDMDEKLSNVESAWKCHFQKQKLEEPNAAQANIMISSNLSSKKEGKKKPLQIDEVRETGLKSAEHSAFSFVSKLQDHRENTASKHQQRGERRPHSLGLQMNKIVPDDKKFDLKASNSPKQQMQKGVKAGDLNGMVMKSLMQPVRLDSNSRGAVLGNSVLQPEKRTKYSISAISAVKAEEFSDQMDCSNSPRTSIGSSVKDEHLTLNSYSVGDLGTEDVKPFLSVATDVTDLRRLKMNDLKAIAKQLRLTRYYKLKKEELIELITSHC